MDVSIIGCSGPTNSAYKSNPLDIVYTALSQCYNDSFSFEDAVEVSDKKKEAVICLQGVYYCLLEMTNLE